MQKVFTVKIVGLSIMKYRLRGYGFSIPSILDFQRSGEIEIQNVVGMCFRDYRRKGQNTDPPYLC